MSDKTFTLSLPDSVHEKDVTFKLYSKTKPIEKVEKFCVFSIHVDYNGTIPVLGKTIPFQELLIFLQENGLSKSVPCFVAFAPAFRYTGFNWNPIQYQGPNVWSFQWKGVTCSVAGQRNLVDIRVHDLTPGVGERVFKELFTELAFRHHIPVNPKTFTVYTAQRSPNGYAWGAFSSRLQRSLDTIYIDPTMKRNIVSELQEFKDSAEIYERFGVTHKMCLLFHGPPGGGKSSFVTALSSHREQNIAKLTITPELNGRDVENLVATVPANTDLLVEDVDGMFVGRRGVGNLDFSTFINCLDGLTTKRGLVCFFTTNHIENLDPAMIRPGRIDCCVSFQRPQLPELRLALESLAADFSDEHEEYLAQNPKISIAELQKHVSNKKRHQYCKLIKVKAQLVHSVYFFCSRISFMRKSCKSTSRP